MKANSSTYTFYINENMDIYDLLEGVIRTLKPTGLLRAYSTFIPTIKQDKVVGWIVTNSANGVGTESGISLRGELLNTFHM